jgi:methyl-accepting chemotaxis protein
MKKFVDLKLRSKLVGGFLLASILPLVAIIMIITVNMEKSILRDAFAKLKAVQMIKKEHVKSFFQNCLGDIEIYAFNRMVIESTEEFCEAFKKDGMRIGENWRELNYKYAPEYKKLLEIKNYNDIYIISKDGDVVYTTVKRFDLGQNVISGPLSSSVLGRSFANGQKRISFMDFTLTDKPCSFISAPIISKEGILLGVLVFQISIEPVKYLMQEKSGMGETDETYLVGSDKLMRSDSFRDPIMHSVNASFKGSVERNGVNTEASRNALAGMEDQGIILNYNNLKVLSCYAPLYLPDGVRWAIITEINHKEVKAPLNIMLWKIIWAGVIIAFALGLIGFFMATGIAKPIKNVIDMIKDIALGEGDLARRINIASDDETGELASWFNTFVEKIHDIILQVKGNTERVASAANEVNTTSVQLASGAKEQTSQTREVANRIKEMATNVITSSRTANKVTWTADLVNQIAKEGIDAIQMIHDGMEDIVRSSFKASQIVMFLSDRTIQIENIIMAIRDIAEQTKVLALNATIEAVKAGDYGRGFSVVANEVRKLAERTKNETQEITDTVDTIQGEIHRANKSMREALELVNRGKDITGRTEEVLNKIVNSATEAIEMIQQIATISREQGSGAEQISLSVEAISKVTRQSESGAVQLSEAAKKLNSETLELQNMVNQFKLTNGKESP